MKYLDLLLKAAAQAITKSGTAHQHTGGGRGRPGGRRRDQLPDYWRSIYGTFPSLDLLQALGGAVK